MKCFSSNISGNYHKTPGGVCDANAKFHVTFTKCNLSFKAAANLPKVEETYIRNQG